MLFGLGAVLSRLGAALSGLGAALSGSSRRFAAPGGGSFHLQSIGDSPE
jgi:hypothetical protein